MLKQKNLKNIFENKIFIFCIIIFSNIRTGNNQELLRAAQGNLGSKSPLFSIYYERQENINSQVLTANNPVQVDHNRNFSLIKKIVFMRWEIYKKNYKITTNHKVNQIINIKSNIPEITKAGKVCLLSIATGLGGLWYWLRFKNNA